MENSNYDARLNSLEKRNRFLGIGLITMVIAFVGYFGWGYKFWPSKLSYLNNQKSIITESLVLKDKEGNDRMTIRGTGFDIRDAQGKIMVLLSGSSGGSIFLMDRNGDQRISMSNNNDNPFFSIKSKDDKSVIIDGPFIRMLDATDTTRVAIGISDEQGPKISFYDEDFSPMHILGVNKDGPYTFFLDKNGTGRISFSTIGGRANLALLDSDGKVRSILGSTPIINPDTDNVEILNEGSLTLFNKEGKVTAKLPQ